MATGYEVEMYRNIGSIAQSMAIIAACMSAAEDRAQRHEKAAKEFAAEEFLRTHQIVDDPDRTKDLGGEPT